MSIDSSKLSGSIRQVSNRDDRSYGVTCGRVWKARANVPLPGMVSVELHLMSFGNSYGPARVCDVHDQAVPPSVRINARRTPPPSFIRGRTGLNRDLAREFFQLPGVEPFYDSARERVLEGVVGAVAGGNGGRVRVCIACGCHAGAHRSVAIVERLAGEDWNGLVKERLVALEREHGDVVVEVLVTHRDLDKWRAGARAGAGGANKGGRRDRGRRGQRDRTLWSVDD